MPYVLSPRDLVSRTDNMDETVLSSSHPKYLRLTHPVNCVLSLLIRFVKQSFCSFSILCGYFTGRDLSASMGMVRLKRSTKCLNLF